MSLSKKVIIGGIVFGLGGALVAWYYYKKKSLSSDRHLSSKEQFQAEKLLKKVQRQNREIIIVSNTIDWVGAYSYIKAALDECQVIGFDCEWVTEDGKPKPVALVQIATQHGVCVLCRIYRIQHDIPKSFVELLENKSILKVGVGTVQDGKRLHKDYGINVQGCVDLRYLVARHRVQELSGLSLKNLAADILGVTLDKDINNRCSNWEAEVLEENQKIYAAEDAMVAVDIFTTIVINKMTDNTSSQIESLLKYYSCPFSEDLEGENVAVISEFSAKAHSICQGIVDVNYNQKGSSQAACVSELLTVIS